MDKNKGNNLENDKLEQGIATSDDVSGEMREQETKHNPEQVHSFRSMVMTGVIILIFLAGAGLLLYPTVSNMWNRYKAEQFIGEYGEAVEHMPPERIQKIWKKAKAYNKAHDVNIIMDAWNDSDEYVMSHPYDTLLEVSGNGLMGSIKIPKIAVDLPIYHGISAKVLEKGVGHIEGTSLPVGGKSTHSVLSGHRGLPSMKLFTDLDKIEEGDKFFLHIMDKVLAYEVDQIKVVKPKLVKDLDIVPGKDYVTLVTCTPYGVNSHRMLVRGHRTKYVPEEEKTPLTAWFNEFWMAIIALAAGILIFLIILIVLMRRKKKDKRGENKGGKRKKK